MEQARPIVLGLLFIVLIFVLLNPPSGGSEKSGDHKDKDKGGPKKH